MQIDLTLPRPHPVQREFIKSKAKRKVVVGGRRGGKTMGFSELATEQFLGGRRVLYAGPIADQTEPFWERCVQFLYPAIEAGVVYKNETRRILAWLKPGAKLKTGDDAAPEEIDELSQSRIRAKTAHNADSLRGDWGDLVILDEYATMDPDVDTVVAPMMLDTNGDLVYGGTPRLRNHFHAKYAQAVGDETGRWGAWHFTSHQNPHLSAEALAEITADLTERAYRQEIMAEFLDNEGAVFRNLAACMGAGPGELEKHVGHRIVAGVDWAKHSDYTAASVGCADCRREVVRDRFNQIDYAFQRGRLETLLKPWRVTLIEAEANAMGEPIVEQLQRDGLPVHGFQTTAASKPPLIENLALTFERAEWQFQADPIWTAELEAYERKVSPNTGRSSYGAPEGMHDDTVMARALMIWAANAGVTTTTNPFYN